VKQAVLQQQQRDV